jgi:MFS family permease
MNWFTSKRGLILGLGQMGGGFSFTYGMVAEAMIHQLGWRHAYLALAGILVAVLLPLHFFLFHYRPEDKELKAYGAVDVQDTRQLTPEVATTKDHKGHEWTLGQAMHTSQLWLMVVSQFLYWGIGCYLILAHQIKLAEDAGYSSVFAVSVFALYGIVMVAGQFSGFISDRIGREKAIILASLLAIGGLTAMISVKDTSSPWLLYTYAICFGYGAGLFSVTIFAGAADIFHGKHFGTISGMLLAGMGVGGAIGPWLGGYLYDTSGSYTNALILCISCIGFASLCFCIAAPRNAARLRARL